MILGQLKIEDIGFNPKELNAIEFEKDDDSNYHIDFMHAAANLRARNYKIYECDQGKTKMIAGKIIPAIATTTAMITGCVGAEMYKYVQGFSEIESFKNGFINLALPLFVFSEPTEVNKNLTKEYDVVAMGKVKAIPDGFTIYDKLLVEGPLTVQGFLDHVKEKFGVELSMISAGKYLLYNPYLRSNPHKVRLPLLIEEVFETVSEGPVPATHNYLAL